MNIQDAILSLGSIVLVAALLPSVFGKDKPALSTSLTISIVLFTFAGVYASLALWMAAATTALQASLWMILAVQRFYIRRRLRGTARDS